MVVVAYRVYGELTPARDNVVVCPTYYSGRTEDNRGLIGRGAEFALDTERY
eukprot:gene9897-12911_t